MALIGCTLSFYPRYEPALLVELGVEVVKIALLPDDREAIDYARQYRAAGVKIAGHLLMGSFPGHEHHWNRDDYHRAAAVYAASWVDVLDYLVVGNEVAAGGVASGNQGVHEYAEMVLGCRAAFPDVLTVGPCDVSGEFTWLDEFLATHPEAVPEIISLNPYGKTAAKDPGVGTGKLWPYLNAVKAHVKRPLAITEIGMQSDDAGPVGQAEYLGGILRELRPRRDLIFALWFNLQDFNNEEEEGVEAFGLLDLDGNWKPSAYVFQQVMQEPIKETPVSKLETAEQNGQLILGDRWQGLPILEVQTASGEVMEVGFYTDGIAVAAPDGSIYQPAEGTHVSLARLMASAIEKEPGVIRAAFEAAGFQVTV